MSSAVAADAVEVATPVASETNVSETSVMEMDTIISRMKKLSAEIFLSTERMIEFGRLADELKSRVKHGVFGKLIKEHFPGVSIQTVRNWRQLAKAAIKNTSLVKMEPIAAMTKAGIVKQVASSKSDCDELPNPDAKPKKKLTPASVPLLEQIKQLTDALRKLPTDSAMQTALSAALADLQTAITSIATLGRNEQPAATQEDSRNSDSKVA